MCIRVAALVLGGFKMSLTWPSSGVLKLGGSSGRHPCRGWGSLAAASQQAGPQVGWEVRVLGSRLPS